MDIKQLLTDKESELQPLFARMDADREQVYATGYTLRNARGHKAKNAYHVQLLEAKHFVSKAIARLCSVTRQTIVESDSLDDRALERIEHFLEDLQMEIDVRLSRKGQPDTFTQHAELVCVRGPIAEQVLLRLEGGRLVPDVRPVDCRYFLYEADADGMRWAAPFYLRLAADIEGEYGIRVSGRAGLVYDYWDAGKEVVLVDGIVAAENPNPYGFTPFVTAFPQATTALRDEDSLKHRGDSILHLCRTADGGYLYDERNFIASIVKTQAGETLKPPLQKGPREDGSIPAVEDGYPLAGDVLSTDSLIREVPKPDVRRSTEIYSDMVNAQLRQATFTALDYGSIELPLSAVAISRIMEGKNEMLLPRLNCIASLFQSSARMRLAQFIKLGKEVSLGEEGHRRSYSPEDLSGEYSVKYRFHTTSQEQLASAAAIAASLGDLVDEKFKLEEILQLSNPAEMMERRREEAVLKASPARRMFREVMSLIDKRDRTRSFQHKRELDIEARLQLRQLISVLKRGAQLEEESKQKPESVLPVFSKGKGEESARAERLPHKRRGYEARLSRRSKMKRPAAE